MTGPIYASVAVRYLELGYSPLPLPPGAKWEPPKGYTGRKGTMATAEEVAAWSKHRPPDANVALRLPAGVIGIDVDAHKGLAQREAWDKLVAELGLLPEDAPWSSSRDDGVSGIRLFRVPDSFKAAGDFGIAGEVIQWHHRYVVAPPSVVEGRVYKWMNLNGGKLPAAADLPPLPDAWREGIAALHASQAGHAGAGGHQAVTRSAGWTAPDIGALVSSGIPPDHPQDDVLRDVVFKLRSQGLDRGAAFGLWLAIVAKTSLTRPGEPWAEADFDRQWRGAVAKLDEVASEPPEPLAARPQFPVTKMSGPYRKFLDWGIADGLHAECVAAAALAALATVTGPARLQLNAREIIRAILWVVLIGLASSGKTPAYKHAFALIREDFARRHEEYERELDDFQAMKQEKDGPSRPCRPQACEMDDATIEAVARWLKARRDDHRDSSGAVIDDELAAFLDALGQYKNGRNADRSKWLKLWSGVPLHVERVGDGGTQNAVVIYVPEPVVSLSGPLVPDNIHLLGKPASGFRPRWIPFYAPDAEPARNESKDYPEEWVTCMGKLLADRCERSWNLSRDARSAWEQARTRWRDQQSEPESDDVIEALRKADDQCLRLALVFAESLNPGAPDDPMGIKIVGPAAVSMAIAVIDYEIDVWRSLPGNSTMNTSRYEDVMDEVYRRFVSWLERRPAGNEGLPEGSPPRARATRREIQRWLHEKPRKLDALIREHAERWPGCVVKVERERDEGGHGGMTAVYIYAPPRVIPGVAATPGMGTDTSPPQDENQGQGDAGTGFPGVAGATPEARDTGSATPGPGPDDDADSWVREAPDDLDDPQARELYQAPGADLADADADAPRAERHQHRRPPPRARRKGGGRQ